MATQTDSLVVCQDCDAVYRKRPLARGEKARCRRCHALLYRHQWLSTEAVLALSVAGLIVFVIANTLPVFSISGYGKYHASTLLGVVTAVWNSDFPGVATVVAVMLWLIPLLQFVLLTWASAIAVAGWRTASLRPILHVLQRLRPWGMLEVWMLGILVAIMKLRSMFDIHAGVGPWAFAVLMLLFTPVVSWDLGALWEKVPERRV